MVLPACIEKRGVTSNDDELRHFFRDSCILCSPVPQIDIMYANERRDRKHVTYSSVEASDESFGRCDYCACPVLERTSAALGLVS